MNPNNQAPSLSTEHSQWNDTQKEFYNVRHHKRMWYQDDSRFVRNTLEKFLSFSGLSKSDRILEIGCGAGRYTLPLLKMGYNITGVDISQNMLTKLREDAEAMKLPSSQYKLICGDYDTLNFSEADKFDCIVGFNVLHHLFDVNVCLQNIRKHLKPQGHIAFVEPNALNPLHYIDSLLDGGWKAEGHKSASLPEKIKESLEKTDFTAVAYERFGFFPPMMINRFSSLLKVERSIEERGFLSKMLPFFIIKAHKV
jgi:SAM-dependent methyltransferase